MRKPHRAERIRQGEEFETKWQGWRQVIFCVSIGLVLLVQSAAAVADEAHPQDNKATVIFNLENDAFVGTDKHYTNGIKATWISKDLKRIGHDGLPAAASRVVGSMPAINEADFLHNIAVSLGQNIYTPRDLSQSDLIDDDRPYAGWTYFAFGLHSKNFRLLNTLELSLGIVGPSSLAGQTQKMIHEQLNSDEPMGWENQLEDEFGFMFTWQRFWRVRRQPVGSGFAYDIIPHAGFSLGNVFTYLNAGGEIRFGYNLPADFGSSLIRPAGGTAAPVDMSDPRLRSSADFGCTVFGGVDGRATAQNIFLDGNTWDNSHSVDKNYFVVDISAGVGLVYKHFKLTYTHVFRTEEFEDQDGGQSFGSISLALTF
jgi:hypothetical protein